MQKYQNQVDKNPTLEYNCITKYYIYRMYIAVSTQIVGQKKSIRAKNHTF